MFKILIIDPNAPFRKTLIKSISSQFPAVKLREAGYGEEGLYHIDAFAPQMIFIDIYLPDINGLDLAKKIRASHPEIIMAIFARYDSPEYQEAAKDSGVAYLIPKDDWTSRDIVHMVETVLCQLPVL